MRSTVGGDHQYDPLGSLYTLLERDTASEFIDEFAEVAIDASDVVWIATANDARAIPEPILNRMNVYSIDAPDAERLAPHRPRASTASCATNTAWVACFRRNWLPTPRAPGELSRVEMPARHAGGFRQRQTRRPARSASPTTLPTSASRARRAIGF